MVAAKISVESHIARVREAIWTLQNNLDILLQSITNARKGVLQPQVVSPKLIMDAPFPLSKNPLNLDYKVYDINVYLDKNVLGYVITLPLMNGGIFKVYRMIPVPISLGSYKFAYVNIEESNLCSDETRQYYFGISDSEFEKCKNINGHTKLCKQTHPLLSSHLQESCAVKLLQTRTQFPKNCDTRLVQIKNTLWTQLDNNEWLYFAPISESVTVLCNDKGPLDVTLTGVGKITLYSGCKGYRSVALLQAKIMEKTKAIKKEDIISRIHMDEDCLEELGIRFNTSSSPVNIEFKHVASHLEDLKHASYKISELEKEIKHKL
jgi:hypothetical protein